MQVNIKIGDKMKHILGVIDTENPEGEQITIEYNDESNYYKLLSNINGKKLIFHKDEIDKLYTALDNIENYYQ